MEDRVNGPDFPFISLPRQEVDSAVVLVDAPGSRQGKSQGMRQEGSIDNIVSYDGDRLPQVTAHDGGERRYHTVAHISQILSASIAELRRIILERPVSLRLFRLDLDPATSFPLAYIDFDEVGDLRDVELMWSGDLSRRLLRSKQWTAVDGLQGVARELLARRRGLQSACR